MNASLSLLLLLFVSSALGAEPADVITVILQNKTNMAARRIQVRAEAFSFDVRSLQPGESATRTVPRKGRNCGVAVNFKEGRSSHQTGAALMLPDKITSKEVRLGIESPTKLHVSVVPAPHK